MPNIVREQYEDFTSLEVALRAIFILEMEGTDQLAALFNEADSADATENHMGDSGFGDVPEYKGKIEYETTEPLWKKTYTHVEYAKGLGIERKLIDDHKFNIINQKTRSLGMAFNRNVMKARADIFNNAFDATNHPGPDGVALCSATHDYSPTNGSHQINYQALDLTDSNVTAVAEAMMGLLDPKGQPFPVIPDTLVVPTSLLNKARVIVGSQQKSGTANNDVNINGGYNILWSPYLSDSNAWFLVDSRLASLYLNFYWRARPEFLGDPASEFDLTWRYRGYMRYSLGFDDYRWVYGCNPS